MILWGAISTPALVPLWDYVCEEIEGWKGTASLQRREMAEMMQTKECRERKCDNRGDENPLKSASSVIVHHHYEEKGTVIGSQPLMGFAKGLKSNDTDRPQGRNLPATLGEFS